MAITPRQKARRLDPFTVEIIKNGLVAAAEEMFYSLGRTAKSPIIYEVLDLSLIHI